MNDAAQRRNQELQHLAQRLVELQEAERGHLAHELHEEIGQVLAGIKLAIATLPRLDEDEREKQLRRAQGLLTDLMQHVRALSVDLRPGLLDDLGLLPALQWYCKHYAEQNQVAVNFSQTGLDNRLDGTVETAAYRIVQEGVTNTVRLTHAREVDVRLEIADEYLLIQVGYGENAGVADNANCFCDHSGLVGIQQRATLIGGECRVDSKAGERLLIEVSLPLVPVYTSLTS